MDRLGSIEVTTGAHRRQVLQLLAHPNVASKEDIIRRYDHEVRGGTVVRPYVGPEADGPADAAVLKPLGTEGHKAVVLSNGICPPSAATTRTRWHSCDGRSGAQPVAVGGDPDQVAVLDNFCWGDPTKPDRPVRSFAPCRVAPTALAPIGCRSSPARTRCSTSSMVKQSPAPC